MSEIRKVPASAGAEWLLTGFSLLRRAPLALGMLGMTWGLVALLVYGLASLVPALGVAAQFLMVLAGPIFMGGMLWAVREVDEGRPAQPAHLLHGFQSAFRTLGVPNGKYIDIIRAVGYVFAVIVSVAFAMMPVSVYLEWIS